MIVANWIQLNLIYLISFYHYTKYSFTNSSTESLIIFPTFAKFFLSSYLYNSVFSNSLLVISLAALLHFSLHFRVLAQCDTTFSLSIFHSHFHFFVLFRLLNNQLRRNFIDFIAKLSINLFFSDLCYIFNLVYHSFYEVFSIFNFLCFKKEIFADIHSDLK